MVLLTLPSWEQATAIQVDCWAVPLQKEPSGYSFASQLPHFAGQAISAWMLPGCADMGLSLMIMGFLVPFCSFVECHTLKWRCCRTVHGPSAPRIGYQGLVEGSYWQGLTHLRCIQCPFILAGFLFKRILSVYYYRIFKFLFHLLYKMRYNLHIRGLNGNEKYNKNFKNYININFVKYIYI